MSAIATRAGTISPPRRVVGTLIGRVAVRADLDDAVAPSPAPWVW
jgi:hypothetical protein